jgi:predicted DNA binding protein
MSHSSSQAHENSHYRELTTPENPLDLEASIRKAEEVERSLTVALGNASLTPKDRKALEEAVFVTRTLPHVGP